MPLELYQAHKLGENAARITEVGPLLSAYGNCEMQYFPSGDLVLLLPTRTMPIDYFNRQHWKLMTPMTNFRRVYSVDRLTDGTRPKIVVKSPERVFTKEKRLLDAKYPWWGGPRTSEKTVHLPNNPVVEAQSVWEAIILMELYKNGIRAEIPQALIKSPNGRMELVVNDIPTTYLYVPDVESSLSPEEITTNTGLHPSHDFGCNVLNDEKGHSWIIDVNRWSWPPYTDDQLDRLLDEIRHSD